MIRVDFSTDIESAVRSLTDVGHAAHGTLLEIGDMLAWEAELRAKLEAPWQDRTGNARRTLDGWCRADEADEDTIYVGLSGHMEYSPVLELGHDGRYAVIFPVISEIAQRLKNMRLI